MTVPIWIGLWHLAWMAYRWGHALSRHTSVTQICLINRRTSTVKEQIGIVKSPVGMPGRAIFNTFIKHGSHKIDKKCLHCLEHCNPKEIPYCITRALIAAAKGNLDEALLFCGANAWKAEKLEHVADIMEELK